MARYQQERCDVRSGKRPGGYVVLVRAANGRFRLERFHDPAAYRARLKSIARSEAGGISIDEIAGLLDTL